MAASKRKRDAAFDDEPAKSAAKRPPTTKPLASIFAKPAPLTWRIRDDDGLYHLVYGNPEARDKVAIFDLDDCLTKRLPKTALCAAPWKWMYEDIPKALREAEKAGCVPSR